MNKSAKEEKRQKEKEKEKKKLYNVCYSFKRCLKGKSLFTYILQVLFNSEITLHILDI